MLRRLQALVWLMLAVGLVSLPAAAEEPDEDAAPAAPESAPQRASEPERTPAAPATAPPHAVEPERIVLSEPVAEVKPAAESEGWHTEVTGYFRAPVALGISSRPGPDNLSGPSSTQVSYGPNRTVDASYYSFAYTRLQEQDWAEVFVHAKHKHVDAAVGWMGYWFQAAGFRNPDASWAPGLAYIALDTDFQAGPVKPNVALTMGAWWPKFGYFEKYDTYTLGRFRQVGEQLNLTIPLNSDLTLNLIQGFGTNRDGSFSILAPPLYGGTVGIDLLTYEHIELTHKKYFDVGLHYNTEWTADPNLTQQTTPGKSYADAKLAHLTVVGTEINVRVPVAGHFWVSPSFIHVRDGWALANGGTEVMHSQSGLGIATNYLGWTNTPDSSTGSGTMLNVGFLWECTLAFWRCKELTSTLPEFTVNVFGLFTKSSLNLPANSTFPQNSFKELKYGADLTIQALDWLSFMLRYDLVNYDMDHGGYIFSAVTPRVMFSSHFLSRERLYIQYTRYTYGDKMVLNGTWPWGAPLVAGANNIQGGSYSGKTPDQDVVKFQAEIAF